MGCEYGRRVEDEDVGPDDTVLPIVLVDANCSVGSDLFELDGREVEGHLFWYSGLIAELSKKDREVYKKALYRRDERCGGNKFERLDPQNP
jgi:hypothetical protein